jgi:hypothetical protein
VKAWSAPPDLIEKFSISCRPHPEVAAQRPSKGLVQ